ncbi:MAG: DUF4097 family beta strand repeat-containing protein [Ilumatobacteraceae bacterium]|nr:DUF4097 family beta strand repeat protein [Ilumatobacter sp.]MCB0984224.1 DUF4097 family beta strand repeat protein [Ilumatobacter sp.]
MNRHERWPVGAHPVLDVGVPSGSVEVRVGEAGWVQASLESSAADDFEMSAAGDHVTIRHPSRWSMRGRSCRLTVTVPSGCDVQIDAASATIRLVGSLGGARVRTASGDLTFDRLSQLDATSASGDISGDTVEGDASLTAISGNCALRRVGGSLRAGLTSADLRVDACDGDVTVGTTSGTTRIGHCGGSDISVRSVSGDVRLGLPSGIRVEADLSTVSGRARLPDAAPSTGERRPVHLKVKTVSGDIRIERSR